MKVTVKANGKAPAFAADLGTLKNIACWPELYVENRAQAEMLRTAALDTLTLLESPCGRQYEFIRQSMNHGEVVLEVDCDA